MTRTRLAPGPLCLELEIAEKSGGTAQKAGPPTYCPIYGSVTPANQLDTIY